MALAVVLVPFALFGSRLETGAAIFLRESEGATMFLAVVALLAGDIFLPIPSSVVSLTAGAALGTWLGAAAIWAGMTTGCAVGWAAGRGLLGWLSPAAEPNALGSVPSRLVGLSEATALVFLRPIPVLAEISVLVLSARGMTFRRMISICAAANVPVAVLFAYFGALAIEFVPFSYLVGSLLFTALVIALLQLIKRR